MSVGRLENWSFLPAWGREGQSFPWQGNAAIPWCACECSNFLAKQAYAPWPILLNNVRLPCSLPSLIPGYLCSQMDRHRSSLSRLDHLSGSGHVMADSFLVGPSCYLSFFLVTLPSCFLPPTVYKDEACGEVPQVNIRNCLSS